MCTPVALGVIAAVSAVGSAAAAGVQYENSQSLQKSQNDANAQWVAYQENLARQAGQASDAARTDATTAQEKTLQNFDPANQTAIQQQEQQRLNTLYTDPSQASGEPVDPNSVAQNDLLSGESSGNQTFMNSLTSQVNNATQQARGRIAALATVGSYGNSFGGLNTQNQLALQQGGNAIQLANAKRQADISAFGTGQQVQPLNYTFGPNAQLTQSLGSALGGIAGDAAGYYMNSGTGTGTVKQPASTSADIGNANVNLWG